jgi:hypothetical protein
MSALMGKWPSVTSGNKEAERNHGCRRPSQRNDAMLSGTADKEA